MAIEKYNPFLVYLGALVTTDVTSNGVTKIFSFGQQTVLGGIPAVIHSIRVIADKDPTATISITAYPSIHYGSTETKTVGTIKSSDGSYTVPTGGIAGQYFKITWSTLAAHHLLGFEIEYSLAGKRS